MTSPTRHGLSPGAIETLAGLSAGLVSTIIVHPLDIIKTRLQVDTSAHPLLNSSRAVLHDILRNEGPTRIAALYRGLTPNLVGNSAGWALYFLWYKEAQDVVRSVRGYAPGQQLTSFDYLSASAASGMLSAILTNPIWVVKTRMLSTSSAQTGAYPGMIYGLRSIYRTEGIRGFFHGMTPSLFGVSHGALYFVAYEKLKLWRKQVKKDAPLSNADTLLTSSLSKVFAGLITYPHQVVRARLQTYDPSAITPVRGPGMVDLIKQVWHNEGIVGFYKGLFPNLLRVVPSTCVTFLVYENVRWRLPRMFGAQGDEAAVGVAGNANKKETM
ncbi:MC family mitochondrial carrier protein [Exophiala viscosa]|uniref:MC family mitochondrial carrier protein n=1 Tax=Exophiala viscosa TaxID=2486360 RepID=A0AAN6E4N4_9EURO|nr:MC family mitochondrial carrier protein [Exophiala viscosa]KAI1627156.1 MC family mitochondrial carrier protein [Exophiala viscosa]